MVFELRQAVDAYDFIQKQITECDQRLQELMAELSTREPAPVAAGDGAQPAGRKTNSTRNKKNLPRFDLKAEL
jgi:phosphopentomutase